MIITQIENAIIARVKQLNTIPEFGNLVKTVARFSGDFADENLQTMVTSAPCVLVSHTSSVPIINSSTGTQWDGEFTIVCGATSRRVQPMASRAGGILSTELGSRPIAELVRDILTGQSLGLPIKALEPLAIDEIYSGQAGGAGGQHFFSVTGLRVTTRYSTTRSTDGDPQGIKLAEIVANFITSTGAGAPIDDAADNTSTVTLPGAPS